MITMMQRVESRTRVYLNGVGLADIDPSIIIRDVSYQVPQIATRTVERARYHGSHVTRQRMDTSGVTVTFEIREYSPSFRQSVAERVTAWAMSGGVLTTDDRPGKRLHVVCTTPPAIESALKWTDALTLGFSAFDNPFWEDAHPSLLVLTGISNSGQMYGPGSASDPFVEVDVKPASSTMHSLTLTAGSSTMTFLDLTIPSGKTFSLYYDQSMILHAVRADTGAALLSKRSAASADDLMITRGVFSTVSYTADVSVSATFKTRGLYL